MTTWTAATTPIDCSTAWPRSPLPGGERTVLRFHRFRGGHAGHIRVVLPAPLEQAHMDVVRSQVGRPGGGGVCALLARWPTEHQCKDWGWVHSHYRLRQHVAALAEQWHLAPGVAIDGTNTTDTGHRFRGQIVTCSSGPSPHELTKHNRFRQHVAALAEQWHLAPGVAIDGTDTTDTIFTVERSPVPGPLCELMRGGAARTGHNLHSIKVQPQSTPAACGCTSQAMALGAGCGDSDGTDTTGSGAL